MNPRRSFRSLPARAGTLALLFALTTLSAGAAEPVLPPLGTDEPAPASITAPTPAPITVTRLTLAEAVRLALERQPRVAAWRASLAAARDGYRALDELRVPELL